MFRVFHVSNGMSNMCGHSCQTELPINVTGVIIFRANV